MNKSTFVQRLAFSLLPVGILIASFKQTLKQDKKERPLLWQETFISIWIWKKETGVREEIDRP